MIGTNRKAPGDKVMSLAVPDKRWSYPDGLSSFIRLAVVDLSNMVLGHAAFQHVHGIQGDGGQRCEILRGGVATSFEICRKG
jgi:hypothetical protein